MSGSQKFIKSRFIRRLVLRELIQEINKNQVQDYIRGFTLHIRTSFMGTIRWPWLAFHVISVIISILLILGGVDWSYFLFYQNHKLLQILLFPAVMIGGLIPFIVPPLIYLYAKKENKPHLEPLAFALTQAAVVATIWIAIYKAITGRLGPELFESAEEDYSTDFAFGILRRGVFHGWPSTHATVAWALAIVYFNYRPEISLNGMNGGDELPEFLNNRKYGFLYAFYVGFGVSTNIHWLSDAVAGVLIGITIGFVVSKTYELHWDTNSLKKTGNGDIYWVSFVLFLIMAFSFFGFDDI
jgi:membrane-associated phospholipid phosphatase